MSSGFERDGTMSWRCVGWIGLLMPTLVFAVCEGAAPPLLNLDDMLLRAHGLDMSPEGLLRFLRDRSEDDADLLRIPKLITQLGDDRYDKREEASRKLVRLELQALAALRANVKHKDAEV